MTRFRFGHSVAPIDRLIDLKMMTVDADNVPLYFTTSRQKFFVTVELEDCNVKDFFFDTYEKLRFKIYFSLAKTA